MPNSTASDERDASKVLAESLYKRGTEIAEKNKTLSLLSRLYAISILALELKEIAQRVCQAIREDLSCELVGILLHDTESGTLQPIAFNSSKRLLKLQTDSGFLFDNSDRLLSKIVFLDKVTSEKQYGYTENVEDIWQEIVPDRLLQEIKSVGHIRSSLAYPLVSGNIAIGVLMISLNRTYDQLLDHEKKSLENFTNVVAIALDRARLHAELKLANARQEGLIHFIGHEVKGSLAKDAGAFAALAEGDFGELEDGMKSFVERALAQSRDGERSVANILKASNLKKGTVTYEKTPFDLSALAAEAVEKAESAAKRKGLAISFSADESGAPYTMSGDRSEIGDHVLRNLIDNAVSYTPSGSITVSLKKENGKILLTVADTGVGITDEDKKRLFTEGGHGKDSQTINAHSTGYGLYITKNIVEAHGGAIRAESEGAGNGATFVVEFPA